MLKQLIRMARAGDDEAARALVGWLAESLRAGTTPPPDLAEYFAQAFERVALGSSADQMLSLGRYNSFGRQYEIARQVWMLNHRIIDPLPLRESSKKKGAYSVVGAKYHIGAERVQQIYRALKGLVEAEFLNDEFSSDAQAKHHAEVQHHIVFAKLAEVLKKQGRK